MAEAGRFGWMLRKPRLEFPKACYHVINRGNYRADIFKTEGARAWEIVGAWEIHEQQWTERLGECLRGARKTAADIQRDRKTCGLENRDGRRS